MSHECKECGEQFDTLTRLRLHNCGTSDEETGLFGSTDLSGLSDDRDATVPAIDEELAAVNDDPIAVYRLIGTFNAALTTALNQDDGGDRYRDVYWSYYEDVANSVDEAAKQEGWSLLVDLAEAYSPVADEEVSLGTPAIQNAVGRHIIRTRVREGVDAIPPAVLEFLENVVDYAVSGDDIAREEAHTYGWGIGHPDYPIADRLQEAVSEHPYWVHAAVEHALYADQHAAVELLDRIVTEGQVDESMHMPGGSLARYMLDCVAGPDSDTHWPTIPRYWDWHDELAYEFAWDSDVEHHIHRLVEETGVGSDLPRDWTFQDLMV